MVVPPKHPKMIIFSRKTMVVGGLPTILGNPQIRFLSASSLVITSLSGAKKAEGPPESRSKRGDDL